MRGPSMFHESYCDHSCLVVNDKDILDTNIKNSDRLACLKRWWYNLFLLSYDDERCRVFYKSSHAMRLERTRQFRQYRCRIHPLSKFSNFWSCFILFVLLVDRIIFQQNTSLFFATLPYPSAWVAVVLEVIKIIDVFLQFKTGYIEKDARRVVLDAKACWVHYASTKLFGHIAAVIPLQSIMLLRFGSEITCIRCKSNVFVSVVKLVSILGLYRIIDATSYWNKERDSFKAAQFFKFLRIFVLGFMTMLQYLNFSDTVNVLIMISNGKVHETSYLAMLMRVKYLTKSRPSNLFYFCMEFSIIFKSLLLFGYGLQPRRFYLDIIFGLLGYLIANGFYVWSLAECYSVVNRLTSCEDQITVHKDRTMNMMRCRQVSNRISAKALQYYDFKMSKLFVMEQQNALHEFLPYYLKKDIKLSCYMKFMKRIPFFAEWPDKVLVDLVMLLKEEVFLENDVVADTWDQGVGLVIVNVGVMAVYSSSKVEIGHLIDGDYFGELSLVTDKEVRTSSVVAVTQCQVLILKKSKFRQYMREDPALFFELRKQLREKYGRIDQADLARTSKTSISTKQPLE